MLKMACSRCKSNQHIAVFEFFLFLFKVLQRADCYNINLMSKLIDWGWTCKWLTDKAPTVTNFQSLILQRGNQCSQSKLLWGKLWKACRESETMQTQRRSAGHLFESRQTTCFYRLYIKRYTCPEIWTDISLGSW